MREQTYLKWLATSLRPDTADRLLSHLESGPLQVSVGAATLSQGMWTVDERLAAVHYSWITHTIKAEPPPLQNVYTTSLPEAVEGSTSSAKLSPATMTFFKKELVSKLGLDAVIPPDLLPPSELTDLLALDKKSLVRLIGYLGLYDLSLCLKKVVQKRVRDQVTSFLTTGQKEYLTRLARRPDPLTPPNVNLATAAMNKEELTRLLQILGARRLAIALQSASAPLTWHIARRLDMGRGNLLLKYTDEAIDPHNVKKLAATVVSLMKALA